MGTEEESTPVKPSKPTASTQEIPTTPSYPDWSSPDAGLSFLFRLIPPFLASTFASPTPHPYIWGGQHPLMPPYGTPIPYPAMYPPGAVYALPSLATTPILAQNNADEEGKGADGKDRSATKISKGTSGSKVGASGKMASGAGNDGGSQCSDSGSEGTSDGIDKNNQQELAVGRKGRFDKMLEDANVQSNIAGAVQGLVPGKPVVSMPATTLNIGMDLWSRSTAATGASKMRPCDSAATVAPGGVMPDRWIQDEREFKRQKRKQSNRESARRSRLRKQAECEELQARVESLSNENLNLREELKKLSDECKKLTSENSSIKDEFTRIFGPDAVTNLEQDNPSSVLQSLGDEGKS